MQTLHIGGHLAQIGPNLNSLTLLKDGYKLRCIGYYHTWSLNGVNMGGDSDNIANKELYKHDYVHYWASNGTITTDGLINNSSREIYKQDIP